MRHLLAISILAIGAGIAPALAQPVEIVVPGGRTVIDDTAPRPIYRDDYTYGPRWYEEPRFDPGAAAINALNVSHFYPARGAVSLNVDRAMTLNATGQSIVEHQLACQSAYASYDMVSDTYLDASGLPVPCRL